MVCVSFDHLSPPPTDPSSPSSHAFIDAVLQSKNQSYVWPCSTSCHIPSLSVARVKRSLVSMQQRFESNKQLAQDQREDEQWRSNRRLSLVSNHKTLSRHAARPRNMPKSRHNNTRRRRDEHLPTMSLHLSDNSPVSCRCYGWVFDSSSTLFSVWFEHAFVIPAQSANHLQLFFVECLSHAGATNLQKLTYVHQEACFCRTRGRS